MTSKYQSINSFIENPDSSCSHCFPLLVLARPRAADPSPPAPNPARVYRSQHHLPGGSSVRPVQRKWNHSIGHRLLSHIIITPPEAWRQVHHTGLGETARFLGIFSYQQMEKISRNLSIKSHIFRTK
jgi:hypothetical protein